MATLLEHCAAQIDTLIAGGGTADVFSTRNDATSTYVYNPGSWVDGIDLTGVSVWNTGGANCRAGTLLDTVGRNWIIAAKHSPPSGTAEALER